MTTNRDDALVCTRVALSAQYTAAFAAATITKIRIVFFIASLKLPLFTIGISSYQYPFVARTCSARSLLFRASQRMLQPQRHAIQEAQFPHQPSQLVGEHQPAHKQQQSSAE